jgi:hypothetical protein
MKFIKGKNRNQLEFYCLEEAIEPNNEVRLIDLFAASLNLADYGFKTEFIENGRPIILRIYFHRIQSTTHFQHREQK